MNELQYKQLESDDLSKISGGSFIDTVKLIIQVIDRLSDGELPVFTSHK